MVGYEYSGGKPRHSVTMREVLSLEAPVKSGEDTACVGGGTKGYLRHIGQGWELYSETWQQSLTKTAIDKACLH